MSIVVKVNRPYQLARSSLVRKAVNSKIRGLDVDTSRFKYNQSPTATPNGILTTFTLPNSDSFVSGLLEVFINGNQKIKDIEWQETGTTQITFIGAMATVPPSAEETIKINYIKV